MGITPFGNLDRARARHHRRWLGLTQPVEMGTHLVADLEDVAHALGHRQRDPGAVSREEGVGGDGEAVHEEVDSARSDSGRPGDAADAVQHGIGTSGRRGHLVEVHARPAIDQHEIGKGAADIHSNAGAVFCHVPVPLSCCHVFTLVPTLSVVRRPGCRTHAASRPIPAYLRHGATSIPAEGPRRMAGHRGLLRKPGTKSRRPDFLVAMTRPGSGRRTPLSFCRRSLACKCLPQLPCIFAKTGEEARCMPGEGQAAPHSGRLVLTRRRQGRLREGEHHGSRPRSIRYRREQVSLGRALRRDSSRVRPD